MSRITKISVLVLLAFILILIRMFEEYLFYDPLIEFFKKDHNTNSLPAFNPLKLLANIALRFLINTTVSLFIIWILFKNSGILKFSALLYAVLFVLLFLVFCYLIFFSGFEDHQALFYIRRFLIQPLFLLILLPAFYFQKRR